VIAISGTQCVDTALRDQTGIDAFVVDARLNERALVIAATANWRRDIDKVERTIAECIKQVTMYCIEHVR
jgi:hypothetical protein